MSAALHGLTTRGRSFLAAGAACVVAALLLGQRDLLRVGILLFALPLACVWVVVRTRYRLSCTRRLEPFRVAAGHEARVSLELHNVSRLPTGLLLVEDRVPYLLGSRPRFVLDRVEPRGRRVVSYPVCSEVRGCFALGPLSIRLTDPFGMCELDRSFAARDALVVTPRTVELPPVQLGGKWGGSGESRSRSLMAAGEDDVATREYRHGDPLHRVHWRSTARYGELMVRREEQPWQSRGILVLDTRARAHRGEGPNSSFEWAVAAAASVGVSLAHHGFGVRLLTDTGESVTSAGGNASANDFEGLLLDTLAVVSPSTSRNLDSLRAGMQTPGSEGLVVAVLGSLDVDQAAEVARLRRGTSPAVAVLLDVSTWEARPGGTRGETERAARLLAANGWRVVRVAAGDDLAQLWPQAAVGMQDLAPAPPPARASAHASAGGSAPAGRRRAGALQ